MPPSRYWFYIFCLLAAAVSLALVSMSPAFGWHYLPALLFSALGIIGAWDLLQTKQAVRRNYPVLAHFRYALESVGPEIRQYFIETDTEENPFSRQQRAIVYQRSKNVMVNAVGTQIDVLLTITNDQQFSVR